MSTPKLSAKFLAEIKQQLLEEKAVLEQELKVLEGAGSGVLHPEYGSDEEENAAEVAEYETNMSIDAGLRKTYRDVLSSLKRVEEGVYGVCKYCSKLIPEARLKARPTSSSCVTCKKAITQEP